MKNPSKKRAPYKKCTDLDLENRLLTAERVKSPIKDNNKQATGSPSQRLKEEMSSDITDLLEQLENTKFDVVNWLDQFRAYINNDEYRMMYSQISNHIFQLNQNELERIDNRIVTVCDQAYAQLDPKNEKSKRLYKAVLKLSDHINLAERQLELLKKNQEGRSAEIEKLMEPKIAGMTKDLTSQLVGLIGIFTALSFIVFGGISSLDSVFKMLSKTLNQTHSVLPAVIVGIIWALCSVNLLFMFMYFVLRIVNRQERTVAGIKEIAKQYPVVLIVDYILVCALTICIFSWFSIDVGLGRNFYNCLVVEHYGIGFVVILFVLVAILGGMGYLLHKALQDEAQHSVR